jgi:HSP20 family molecular chaperone IbpA
MAEQTVATTSGQPQGATSQEGTRAPERYLRPPVDIYETPEGLALLADLPGVAPTDLVVRHEDHILTIQGKAQHRVSLEPVYREYELGTFFRQFQLSEEVDQGRIAAQFRHGVLTLRLPKAEKAPPRQIAVQVS